MSFSTACAVGEYGCMWFFHFLFDAGFVRKLIQNQKCLKIIFKKGWNTTPTSWDNIENPKRDPVEI